MSKEQIDKLRKDIQEYGYDYPSGWQIESSLTIILKILEEQDKRLRKLEEAVKAWLKEVEG